MDRKPTFRRFFQFISIAICITSCSDDIPEINQNKELFFTGIPNVLLNTHGKEIKDRETWVASDFLLRNTLDSTNKCYAVFLHGHGNSTWYNPKKSYNLKLTEAESLLGMKSHKRWILISNCKDPSFLRNSIAIFMGKKFTTLTYIPSMQYVNVRLNNINQGLYLVSEQIRMDRINSNGEGWLIEVDVRANEDTDVCFRGLKTNKMFNIKEAYFMIGSPQFDSIKDYISKVEIALYSNDFLDPQSGYKQLVDINSFAEWYLINEITKNIDSIFFSSCYMYKIPNKKLEMGPLWDFDRSLGNTQFDKNLIPEGFWVKYSVWFERMFKDPEFVELVKNKFAYINAHRDDIMEYIDSNVDKLAEPVASDNRIWNKSSSTESNDSTINRVRYKLKTDSIKCWLNKRLDWLDNAYQNL